MRQEQQWWFYSPWTRYTKYWCLCKLF